MTYYTDLIHEIAILCPSMSLGNAEAFVQAVDQQRLTPTEYIAVLTAAVTRIGGCPNYQPTAAFAVAARITEQTLTSYDPTNGDQTLDLMGLITEYMRYPADSFPAEKVAEGMFSVFETWIDVWVGAEGAIDADWDTGATSNIRTSSTGRHQRQLQTSRSAPHTKAILRRNRHFSPGNATSNCCAAHSTSIVTATSPMHGKFQRHPLLPTVYEPRPDGFRTRCLSRQ